MSIESMDKKIILTMVLLLTSVGVGVTQGFALTAVQRNAVGFQDGLQDCGTGTSTKLNSASNAGHHTQAYMEGYYEGLKSCVTANTNVVSQSQTQGASQGQGFCVTVFSGCTQTLGQSQGQQQN